MLERISSYELSEWAALLTVEAQDEVDRQDDPETWQERQREARRPVPGILVRVDEDAPEEPLEGPDEDNGDT